MNVILVEEGCFHHCSSWADNREHIVPDAPNTEPFIIMIELRYAIQTTRRAPQKVISTSISECISSFPAKDRQYFPFNNGYFIHECTLQN